MLKRKIVVTNLDETIDQVARSCDKKTLVIWALDCAERVLPYFENKYPDDSRPRLALQAGQDWLKTGIFKMAVIRKASLDSHAAARLVENDDVARSAARSAGQAVATTHAALHAIAAARYAATVIRDATNSEQAINAERAWQYQHLLKLKNQHK
jgi:hypothetical protein